MKRKSLTSSPAGRMRLVGTASLATAAFVMALAPSLASAQSVTTGIRSAKSLRTADVPNRGTLGTAARRAMRQGYLVPNRTRYERQKARAARQTAAKRALTAPVDGALAPVKNRAWAGINDVNSAPPDETSAVGTGRYIELVNSKFAIYNKTSNTPVSTGSINSMVGAAGADAVFDVQIMWDATTKRFYYAADDVVSDTNNNIAFGFSKTANPSSAADWCKYGVTFGSTFPDYPKLGDSKSFAIIGSNLFNGNSFVGAHIFAITKPKASDTCASYGSTATAKNKVISGGFTPVPASEVDNNATGWAVAVPLSTPGNRIQLYKVTKNNAGAPVIGTTPTSVPVPSFAVPPAAPQKGTAFEIDTSDTRNTQAQAAIDPGHGSKFAIWTQHTVKGGAGAEVRWYEINPANHSLFQSGKATSPSLFEFNGAIAPNRQVNGGTKRGGKAMLMNFDTSSTTTFPSIKMVSKVGGAAQSGQVAVFNGTKPLTGFDCTAPAPSPCRWGDYAAATPDPSTRNRIWNVSQYGDGAPASMAATSRTWNFIATP
jgi:hypothetical protein